MGLLGRWAGAEEAREGVKGSGLGHSHEAKCEGKRQRMWQRRRRTQQTAEERAADDFLRPDRWGRPPPRTTDATEDGRLAERPASISSGESSQQIDLGRTYIL
jgi:hypothetical protein